ncbi:MAG: PAS domain-containing protein [Candidatus Hydrogenedentes bacterium]|nr:PAS domain-containing protein [Candidatus Hydrogenedentota bacterium]
MSLVPDKVGVLGNASLLAAVLDDIAEGVYIVSQKRQILFWNRGAERITGHKADEITHRWCGDNILSHVDSEGNLLCLGRCPLSEVLATGVPHTGRMYARHRDGHRIPVMTHASPVLDEGGSVIAAVEVFRDATAEEAQRVFQVRFQKVLAQYISPATMDEVLAQLDAKSLERPTVRDVTVMMLELPECDDSASPTDEAQSEQVAAICEVILLHNNASVEFLSPRHLMATFIDANDAVTAARKSIAALHRYNGQHPDEAAWIRVGLNSGRIMQGDGQPPGRHHVTVLGAVMDLAAEIRDRALSNEVWISETTLSRLRDRTAFQIAEVSTPLSPQYQGAVYRYCGTQG